MSSDNDKNNIKIPCIINIGSCKVLLSVPEYKIDEFTAKDDIQNTPTTFSGNVYRRVCKHRPPPIEKPPRKM